MKSKKIISTQIFLIALAIFILSPGTSYAMVPDSTSFEHDGFKVENNHGKVVKVIQKIEQHENENTRFLEDIKNEIKDLK